VQLAEVYKILLCAKSLPHQHAVVSVVLTDAVNGLQQHAARAQQDRMDSLSLGSRRLIINRTIGRGV